MSLTTKMWLRKGCDKIYTKKNAHECRADDGHRWQFVWAQDGMAVSGGGMPYGELDTDYGDGWHNVNTLPLALPDRSFDQFHIIHDRFWEAMWIPAVQQIDLSTLVIKVWGTTVCGIDVSADRLNHIVAGMAETVSIHTPDRNIYWIFDGKRFALLGFA